MLKFKIAAMLLIGFQAISIFAGMTEWFPMEIKHGHVIVEIEIGGKPAKAMLDTGAEGNVISKAFLKVNEINHSKGDPLIVEGVYGKQYTNLIDDLELSFHGTKFTVDRTMPFAGSTRFDMILGMPFFHSFIVQIDYPKKRYRLATHDTFDLKASGNLKFRTNKYKSRLTVPVSIDGKKNVNLLFDTGNSGGILLYRPLAESMGWIEKYKASEGRSSGVVKNNIETEVLVLPEMQFGPFTLENVTALVPEKGYSKNLRSQRYRRGDSSAIRYKGILGYDVLKHFLLTLDARSAVAHLQPSE